MKVVLVYNSKSGSALGERELRNKLHRHSINVEAAIQIEEGFEKKLAVHVKSGATVCVLGGDGTISAVANVLAGTKAVLAPLPGGTLNHFTKDLGIAQDIDEALAGLGRSKIHAIDVARINERVFLNNSSIGLYPASLRERKHFEDRLGKWPAAIIAGIRSFVRFRLYVVTVNNKTFRTPFIFVGNNNYVINSMGVPMRTRLNEGILSLMIARATTRRSLLKIAVFAIFGKARKLEEFDVMKVRTVTIETKKRKIGVSRDGEVGRLTTPIRYKAEPGKLRVRY